MTRAPRRSRHGALTVGLVVFGCMVLVAIVAPIVWGTEADKTSSDLRVGPSGEHWLGTDALGRDLFQRTLVATRLTLLMASGATLIALVGGIILGVLILLRGRRLRSAGERLIGLLVAYPPVIVALALTAIFRPGARTLVVAIGVAFIPQFARLSNTLAASVISKDFVVVARLLGVSPLRMFRRHILPNVSGPLLVLTSVMFGTVILTLSGLSFIGLGVQEPSYDWGRLLATGLQDMSVNKIAVVGPSVAILVSGLALGLIGDGLNHYFDPRLRMTRSQPVPAAAERPTRIGDIPTELLDEPDEASVIAVRNLCIGSGANPHDVPLVRGVSLDVKRGEIVALVGESGSGKTMTAMAISRLLPVSLKWSSSLLRVDGVDIGDPTKKPPASLASSMGIVFQDPSSCFNPAMHIGRQLTEVIRVHQGLSRAEADKLALGRLRETRVSSPEERMRQYPHELSGGMKQRAMIAMALLTSPTVLIADEPTTALDVTVQADVLALLKEINRTRGMAVFLISHDIKVVSALADRICVMYGGRIVEEVTVEALNAGRTCHPYTKALMDAAPQLVPDARTKPLTAIPGRPPRPGEEIQGCAFAPRCPLATDICLTTTPVMRTLPRGGTAACHVSTGPIEEVLHASH